MSKSIYPLRTPSNIADQRIQKVYENKLKLYEETMLYYMQETRRLTRLLEKVPRRQQANLEYMIECYSDRVEKYEMRMLNCRNILLLNMRLQTCV